MGIIIRGVGDVLAMFRAYQNDVPRKIKQARIVKARQILNQAIKTAPKVTGKLRSSGNVDNTTNPNSSEIYFDADYAPYLEFGTGGKVKIPAGFEDLAWEFYENGKGNLKPQPYLIPAFLKGSIEFQNECEQILQNQK